MLNGFQIDADDEASNGCEYACSPTNNGIEICDGIDNDCDGSSDEEFDLQTNVIDDAAPATLRFTVLSPTRTVCPVDACVGCLIVDRLFFRCGRRRINAHDVETNG